MSRRTKQLAVRSSVSSIMGDIRADYAAAKSSRYRRTRTGFLPTGSGADYHYRNENDHLKMMELARDMDRNDTIIGCTIDKACQNTLQGGIPLDIDTGDNEADSILQDLWMEWSTSPDMCDIEGERTFDTMAYLNLRHTFIDGDVFPVLRSDRGCIQTFEAHRIRTPKGTKRNVVNGVLLNEQTRKREAYWITRENVAPNDPVRLVGEIAEVPARDENDDPVVLHVYSPKRFSQTRGVTALAPIVDVCGMFEDLNFAKLVQAQVVSCITFIREKMGDWNGIDGADAYGTTSTGQTQADGSNRVVQAIAPGMELETQPGEKIVGFSPNVPNAEFFHHAKLILTLVGINLGLPLCVMMLDGSETNFSGWRGAVDQARMGFRHNQQSLIERFHKPVYLWKVRSWLLRSARLRTLAARDGVNIFRHKWNPPSWKYIEPLKDALANIARKQGLLTSPRRIAAEDGMDWYDLFPEIIDDNGALIIAAKTKVAEINSMFPEDEPIKWRDVLYVPLPDNVKVSLASMDGASSATQAAGVGGGA